MNDDLQAFVFGRRGTLLALPAVALAALGKPSAFSIALGLPLAFAGEAVRMWAVGYSGVTTRGDTVTAPALVTAGPYARVRNPLYVGNFLTAAGFALAFTGRNAPRARAALVGGSLAAMLAVYAIIVPHEEGYLRETFGADFDDYAAACAAGHTAAGTGAAAAGVLRSRGDRKSGVAHVRDLRRDAGGARAQSAAGAVSAAAGGSTGRLRLALIATAAVAVLEVAGGIRSGSLALLSDAAHVTMDVVALGDRAGRGGRREAPGDAAPDLRLRALRDPRRAGQRRAAQRGHDPGRDRGRCGVSPTPRRRPAG